MDATMSDPVYVRSVQDVDQLKFGDQFIIEPPNPPDDPEEYAELLFPLAEEVNAALAKKFGGFKPPEVTVEFSTTHALITAEEDMSVEVSGDVRDGAVLLRSGRTSKRKLTDEGNGWVSVDGKRFDR